MVIVEVVFDVFVRCVCVVCDVNCVIDVLDDVLEVLVWLYGVKYL